MTAVQPEPNRRQWFVCDMDEGILRKAPTRRLAVRWLCRLHGGTVRARYTYGPGTFEYTVGISGEDHTSAFVVRGDRIAAAGWNPHQVPLYPAANDEFERVDRPAQELGQSPAMDAGDETDGDEPTAPRRPDRLPRGGCP